MAKMSLSSVDDKRYQCECDLRTLMEAEKIKKDKKRYAAAQAMAKEKMMEVASVAAGDNDD